LLRLVSISQGVRGVILLLDRPPPLSCLGTRRYYS